MEVLFQGIFELIFEIIFESSKSEKTPKWLRYILTAVVLVFFTAVIGGLLLLGIIILKTNIPFGILLVAVALFLGWRAVVVTKKEYMKRK